MRPTAGSVPTSDRILVLFYSVVAALAATPLIGSCNSTAVTDPAGWGDDHLGRPLPEFVSGDECLFCHRKKVGPGWDREAHNRTIRRAVDEELALQALRKETSEAGNVHFLLGDGDRVRFLKKSGFGRLSILSTAWHGKRLTNVDRPIWDGDRFGDACAGCHTTAVDAETRRFAALSLDCFVCHGDAPLDHTDNPEKVLLSPRRRDPPRVVISICAQCHLRGGRSRRTGLPYAHHFAAGDNLFRDFEVDLSDEALSRLSTADRHIMENVRAVMIRGDERTTCLTCHSIHRPSLARHKRAPEDESCYTCHIRGASKEERHPFTRGSPICEY